MAAVKGYKCVITIAEKMSEEKVLVLRSLGAQIVRTPAGVPITSPDSIISVARRLNASTPDSHILDQYTNPNNPLAHELGTALEIWTQCDGKVDIVVAGAGTGGTVTGLARGLRRQNPGVVVVGADPVGSVLAQPDELNAEKGEYKVEGIGYDFVPGVLDQSAAEVWVKTGDKEAFGYARRLIREEGLLCGGSTQRDLLLALPIMFPNRRVHEGDVNHTSSLASAYTGRKCGSPLSGPTRKCHSTKKANAIRRPEKCQSTPFKNTSGHMSRGDRTSGLCPFKIGKIYAGAC